MPGMNDEVMEHRRRTAERHVVVTFQCRVGVADDFADVYGGTERFQSDPHWRDDILFYECFHGDNGAGLGASHQTGWTGAVAKLIQLFGVLDAQKALQGGKVAAFARGTVEAKSTAAPELTVR